jgi:DNA-binding CsgD family transcriptional regulator
VARGLEAFAALTSCEGRPERTVQLAAAAAALRETAGLPPLPSARTERYLAPARSIGEPAIERLWAQGLAMTGAAAVALALDEPEPAAAAGHPAADSDGHAAVVTTAGPLAMTGVTARTAPPPGILTPREREIVTLIVAGRSNKAIASELFISPATAARHVANILAKLGFTSRAQIAAWAAGQQAEQSRPAGENPPAAGSR